MSDSFEAFTAFFAAWPGAGSRWSAWVQWTRLTTAERAIATRTAPKQRTKTTCESFLAKCRRPPDRRTAYLASRAFHEPLEKKGGPPPNGAEGVVPLSSATQERTSSKNEINELA
jgi:hypothetical protein